MKVDTDDDDFATSRSSAHTDVEQGLGFAGEGKNRRSISETKVSFAAGEKK